MVNAIKDHSESFNLPSDQNPTCLKCKLFQGCKSPFMESDGSDKPDILVIGEAPGEEEDKKGVPFIGRAGILLRNALSEIGFPLEDIRFTNIVRCRPPDNKISKKMINYCSQFAIQDIETYDPPIVFLLGNSPLNGILGESGISAWNGVIIKKNNRIYVPLYHPAYILRNMNAMDEWLSAMLKIADGDSKKKGFRRTFPKTLREAEEMQYYLSEYDYIGFDTETATLDAFSKKAKLLSVSFAAGNRSFALPINHKESWWDTKTLPKVVEIITNILLSHDGKIIGHHLKFDQTHIYCRLGAEFRAGGDSMVVSHLLDSRQGIHGLKRLAGIHLGMYEYEQELTLYTKSHPEANVYKGGTYDNVPLDILLPYGAMDAEATLRVHDKLYEKLTDKQKILYEELLLPVSDWLQRMEANGIAIDYYVAERYRKIYEIKQAEIYEIIINDPKVKKIIAKKAKELKPSKKVKTYKFNPNSFVQLQELYYHNYDIPVIAVTDSDSPTTSSIILRILEDDYPILKTVRHYKLLGNMLSKYIIPVAERRWSSGDDRARSTFNMHGSRTGRLSSSGAESKSSGKRINTQNIPTIEKEPGTLLEILPIKNLFTHSYIRNMKVKTKEDFQAKFGDGAVMSVDYSGMELRIFASLANCQPMIDIHKSGKDFHSCVTIMSKTGKYIKDITFEDILKIEKSIRYRYKWTNWTLLFGGSAETLHRIYNVPLNEAEETMEEYYRCFPEVLCYADECIEFARIHGYIESPYGRREYLHFINDNDRKKSSKDERSAINMPTQSGAYETLSIAGVIIDNKLQDSNSKAKMINTVHDSIMLDLPKDEILSVADLCVDVMENVKVYVKEYMPNIDMDWLICPLKADVEIGSHYGSLTSLVK